MTGTGEVQAAAANFGLAILGGFHPDMDDGAPENCRTLLLLGPTDGTMWSVFCRSEEYTDGLPDPLDQWSKRVIGSLARDFGGDAIFPSDRPYPPFTSWALRTRRIWNSPAGLLIHETEGLLVSFRGALALTGHLPLPAADGPRPCDACADRPCLSTCPVDAFSPRGYDVAACHAWLDAPSGAPCMSGGCAARRACPVGQGGRPAGQLAFHMRAYHP